LSSESAVTTHGTFPAPGPEPSCPICLRGGAKFFAEGSDRLFGFASGDFRLFRCSSCGCVFQYPMPCDSAIASFYPESYWWEEDRQSSTRIAHAIAVLEKNYREFVLMDHVRFVEHCARRAQGSGRMLLDIGCGSGAFLHLARRRGFVAHGLDLSAQAVAIAQRRYDLDVRQGGTDSKAWEGYTFDFITMFHVLEHLTDPRGTLIFAAEHLKPGGSLIIQVPNVSSLQARLFGTRWYGLDVPRHIINFTPEGLNHLLRKAGLEGKTVTRFSLRDNPASLASSLAPRLDPIGRKARKLRAGAISRALTEILYFALVLTALPFAWLESALGYGGTLWAQARPA